MSSVYTRKDGLAASQTEKSTHQRASTFQQRSTYTRRTTTTNTTQSGTQSGYRGPQTEENERMSTTFKTFV